jgi:hypothetical protein
VVSWNPPRVPKSRVDLDHPSERKCGNRSKNPRSGTPEEIKCRVGKIPGVPKAGGHQIHPVVGTCGTRSRSP